VLRDLQLRGANQDAVRIGGGNNISLLNCHIFGAGRYGININDCSSIKIEGCHIDYANEGGVRIEGDKAEVRDNSIENTGVFAGMGLTKGNGLTALYCASRNGLIEKNRIRNTGYIGIQFKQDSVIIQYNVIDSFCLVTDDGGGIYAHNGSKKKLRGRIIYRNIVLNGVGAPEGTRSANSSAEGIYMDDNTNGVAITENTVANNGGRGIYLHNSQDITITGNTVYNNATQFFTRQDKLGEPIRNCVVTGNIFFSKQSNQYVCQFYSNANDIGQIGRVDSNYYCRPLNKNNIIKSYTTTNYYYSLKDWQTMNRQDLNSAESPFQFTNTNNMRFEYNPGLHTKTIKLPGEYIDVRRTVYKGTVTLKPFTSVILMKKPSGR
jgi:parallel beta-helix repeat protein